MITLLTGTPGAGKTAWIVQEITRLPSQRKIFVHGIPELKIAHEAVYCNSKLCDLCAVVNDSDALNKLYAEQNRIVYKAPHRFYLENWPEWATTGSLIIADEVQRIWAASNGATKPDDAISRLQTHRHLGIDFWLISQSPKLLSTGVRTMIGRHIHLVSRWSGRSEYEWPEINDNTAVRGDAVVRAYKLPKQIFRLYKSSSLHTSITHRKPIAFYATIIAVIAVVILIYILYQRIQSRVNPEDMNKMPENVQEIAGSAGEKVLSVVSPADQLAIDRAAYLRAERPLIVGKPETASVYSKLVKVLDFPIITGCVRSTSNKNPFCNCYSQQGTIIEMDEEVCITYVKHLPFNRFKNPKNAYQNVNEAENLYAKDNDRL